MRRTDDVSLWPWPLSYWALPFGRYGTFCVSALIGLWPWPLTFWLWNWCSMSHVSSGNRLLILLILRLFVFALRAIGPTRLRQITWPCNLDLWPSRRWRLWLMQVFVLHSCTKSEVRRPWHSEDMAHDVLALMSLATLTFDRLTLKLVRKSHLRWGTFLPNLGTLGFWFTNYSLCTRWAVWETDGRRKATFLYGQWHNNSETELRIHEPL